jgi:hypothetical protein
VLDAVHPGGERVADRAQRMCVDGDGQPEAVGLGDGGGQLLAGELGFVHQRRRGRPAAAGHDLHDVAAAVGPLAHRGAQRRDARDGAAEHRAVAVDGGDGRARGKDRGQHAGLLVAQPQGEVVAVAEIAHGRHAGGELGTGGDPHGRQRLLVAAGGEPVDGARGGVEPEMGVRIDQPGQQRGAGQVHQLGSRRRGAPALHPGDLPVRDEDQRICRGGVPGAVEEAGGPDRECPHGGSVGCARRRGNEWPATPRH